MSSSLGANKKKRRFSDACPDSSEDCQQSLLDTLPDGLVIYNILTCLEPADLCNLLATSRRMKDLQDANDSLLWGAVVRQFWDSAIMADAVALAGSYRTFAITKRASSQLGFAEGAWRVPCEYELQASLQRMAAAANVSGSEDSSATSSDSSTGAGGVVCASNDTSSDISTPSSPTASSGSEMPAAHVLFLLDGSGSVGDEEFAASTSFIARAATAAKACPTSPCKVAVMQFSNDVRTEWEDCAGPGAAQGDAFEATIRSMVRMNGGTNIAAALTHAGKVLKRSAPPESPKVIVLITDGRVDGYQAKEARQVASMLSDEQPNTTMFAYGVGRGVDRAELLGIIGAALPREGCKYRAAEARYLDLFYREEAPW